MIASSVNRIIYKGNGSTTAFSYPFAIIDSTDVKVMIVDSSGNKTILTSDYYVDANASIVYYPGYAPGADEASSDTPPVLPKGSQIVLYREVPITQLDQMPDQWPYDVNEDMHDKSCIIDQQLQDGIDRSLKFDVDLAGTFDPTLPIQAGYGWRVSDDGNSIVALTNPEGVYNDTVAVYNQAVADTVAIKDQAETYKDAAAASATSASASAANADSSADLAEAWAQSVNSPDGVEGNKSSKSWAEVAESNATAAATSATYCKAMAAEGAVYDYTKTYEPGDACMTPEGNLWRCITESTGESPSTSTKWVQVSVVNTNTFEEDDNGDLMPLLYPKASSQFDIDDNGDIEPAL